MEDQASSEARVDAGTKTPLVLLVGFLGAGKTTLLKRLIGEARAQWLTPHVILNDFANARVDAEGLRSELSTVIPITGSCVCCSSQYELLAALAEHRHQPRDVMLIETNGTTDASALLTMLAASVRLGGFTPPVQLSVVDAKRFGRRWHGNHLEAHQVRTASHVFISRTDEARAGRVDDVKRAVVELNPGALFVSPGEFMADLTRMSTAARSTVAAEAGGAAAHAAHHYAALSLPFAGAVDRQQFLAFMAALPRQVVRAKGIVEFVDTPGERRMFQRVEDETEVSPHAIKKQDVAPVLVLVGPSLDEASLRSELARLTSV